MKHKHADLIKAWADGEIIQFYDKESEEWLDCLSPSWVTEVKYRIKPEPKPDLILYGRYDWIQHYGREYQKEDDCCKFTFDGETGKLKKAEVL